jgi:hypothetical protein
MEKLLQDILKELQYHTKLLESIVEGRADAAGKAHMEKAMEMVLNMPLFKQMGIDPQQVRNMVMRQGGE